MKQTCLNGWWDFLPLYTDSLQTAVPTDGWEKNAYLVPSFWGKMPDAVRKKGEKFYRALPAKSIGVAIEPDPQNEYLLDGFGYPERWGTTRTAWIRRKFSVTKRPATRYFILAEAVEPQAALYVNGQHAGAHIHPTLPFETDVTALLHNGENELAFLITDYTLDEFGRATVPTGNWIPCAGTGIWQDVWLTERPEIRQTDVTIATSVRKHTLTLTYEWSSAAPKTCTLAVKPEVRKWDKNAPDGCGEQVLTLTPFFVSLQPGQTVRKTVSCVWKEPELWQPENPYLYQLVTTTQYETVCERFGFREIEIDRDRLLLNGYPLHLFSDWGHKMTPYYYTENWIRQWFAMIRDANMNHSRLHTHPHPRIYLDMADEYGILITNETGLHGSGGAQASGTDEYWRNAADHIRRFVRRDKNHPSVILWSVENEMRWNCKGDEVTGTPKFVRELPKLRKLFNSLDPTRPAYHEGDSSLWDEKNEQEILSRHYGREASGVGWWDHQKPLHSGEMSLYHYAGPNNALSLGGDAVYADYRNVLDATALDAAYIIEGARAEGVCCLGPWNLSCLKNQRMPQTDLKLSYPDFNTPGVKPLQVPAYSSEFPFWDKDGRYLPDHTFAIQKNAFRPFAVIDLSLRTAFTAGERLSRTVTLINDTTDPQTGILTLCVGGTVVFESENITVDRGEIRRLPVAFSLPENMTGTQISYELRFESGKTVLDFQTRQWHIFAPVRFIPTTRQLLIYRPGAIAALLQKQNIPFTAVQTLDSLPDGAIVLIEKNTLEESARQNELVRDFLQRDGRVLLAEQEISLLPQAELLDRCVPTAWIRAASQVFNGLSDADLAFWGEDPYAKLGGNTAVASRLYRKPADCPGVLPLADSGEGGFGDGDLEGAALLELHCGSGVLFAWQFEISAKLELPVCQTLLSNLIKSADGYCAPQNTFHAALSSETPEVLLQQAQNGATVLVGELNDEQADQWSALLGIPLSFSDIGPVFQAVKTGNDPLLNGLSNDDICGINRYCYSAPENRNDLVCRRALLPVQGLYPLLITPTASILAEMFEYGGMSEPLRAHTITRFLYGEEQTTQSAVVTGFVRTGHGRIIFNQFHAESNLPKYRRLRTILQTNCGAPGSEALEGAMRLTVRSNGYPTKLSARRQSVGDAEWQQLVEATQPNSERMTHRKVQSIGTWESLDTPADGSISGKGGEILLTCYLFSPTARKNVDTNLSVPNPELLTFLELTGRGRARIALNGVGTDWQEIAGTAVFSDLSLEAGANYLVIDWQPASESDTLTMLWRNIMHKPETGFSFSR